MFVEFKSYFFLNAKRPVPDSDIFDQFIECHKILYYTVQWNNSNQKCKTLSLAYVIHKDAFLPKGASNEEIRGVSIIKLNTILFVGPLCQYSVCM